MSFMRKRNDYGWVYRPKLSIKIATENTNNTNSTVRVGLSYLWSWAFTLCRPLPMHSMHCTDHNWQHNQDARNQLMR